MRFNPDGKVGEITGEGAVNYSTIGANMLPISGSSALANALKPIAKIAPIAAALPSIRLLAWGLVRL
jgi:hypothetical protein